MTPREDFRLLLQAALDGELDAMGMMQVEAMLDADPALAAEYARIRALRDAINARVPRDAAPEALRRRLLSMARAGEQGRTAEPESLRTRVVSIAQMVGRRLAAAPRFATPDARYGALAASLMLGIALGGGASGLFRAPAGRDDVERAVISSYVRGRLSGDPVDIATSDRHTVKPWLATKIAAPATVVDLANDGFPLVGGRIDVIGMAPVATLVYQRREHQIALTEMPVADDAPGAPRRETRDGFSLLSWSHDGRRYMAVTDMPPSELDAFREAFGRAASAEREAAPKREGPKP